MGKKEKMDQIRGNKRTRKIVETKKLEKISEIQRQKKRDREKGGKVIHRKKKYIVRNEAFVQMKKVGDKELGELGKNQV